MKIFGLLLFCWFTMAPAFAVTAKEGFVDIGNKERLWASYKPATRGAPTIVLLHGLTYTMKPWNLFSDALEKLNPDLGILRYDMKGMGKTLLDGPVPVNYEITYQDQVRLLRALLKTLKIEKPTLVGLSYGGAIALSYAATYPGSFDKLILMAPFTEPLEGQDRWIRMQIAATRLAFPLNPATDEELYDFFLRQFIYTTFPAAEPVVLANPYILESIFRMVKSVRLFKASEIVNRLPPASVHLVVANQDQYLTGGVLDRFWNNLPASTRASRINIAFTEHKIPEAIPSYSAAWVHEILTNSKVSGGKVFEGNSWTYKAKSGDYEINLYRP